MSEQSILTPEQMIHLKKEKYMRKWALVVQKIGFKFVSFYETGAPAIKNGKVILDISHFPHDDLEDKKNFEKFIHQDFYCLTLDLQAEDTLKALGVKE